MKRMLLSLAAVLCTASISFSQIWVTQSSGTTNTIRDICFINTSIGWAVGENGTILKTTNGGSVWQSQSIAGASGFIGCAFINETTGWVGGDDGVYKTTNGGYAWTKLSGPTGITKLFFLDAMTGWAVGGRDGSTPYYGDIYKTTDGGATWTQTFDNNFWVRFYGVQFVDASTGWLYTEKRGLLIKTEDGGTTWKTQIATGDTLRIGGMYFLDKNMGWVVGRTSTAGVVLKTTDGGATWKIANGTLAFSMVNPHFTDANNGWAGGLDRYNHPAALQTTDGGATWTPHMGPGTPVLEGANFSHPTFGWAYGDGGLIIRIDIITAVDDRETMNPDRFALDQNYPNPFNPTTSISFSIPAAGFTSLKVFDVLGNETATLVCGQMTAGNHSVTFNASHLTSGVYFYRLQSGAFSETKKLILAK